MFDPFGSVPTNQHVSKAHWHVQDYDIMILVGSYKLGLDAIRWGLTHLLLVR